ncbi:type III effector [Photobacterium sanctipauli]|uniref:Type III effector n=1 Tax=Photobacterium sanctipauli TaxID=1342794 RepID=A0A2T3P071_9GAMM|nr:HopJ type III effector protein [Photobacterium sanctipauli]PSW21910.1 type III effector [Photobacterium sanctipauli]
MDALLDQIKNSIETVCFKDVIQTIEQHYTYTPTAFTNGLGKETLRNEAGQNEGSCKIFAFAKANQLNEAETLACFGDFYRVDVLQHPENTDHQNIRHFMKYGWQGIQFANAALAPKLNAPA